MLIFLAGLLLGILPSCARSPFRPAENTAAPAVQPPAATQPPAAILQETPTMPAEMPAAPQPTQTAVTSDTQALPRPRYLLNAHLDYDQHILNVEEQITYTNQAAEALSDLVLMVPPLDYANVFELTGMSWDNSQPVTGYSLEKGLMRIPLPQELPPGEDLHLSIFFTLRLPSPTPSAATRPVPFGYTALQTNLVDWYPFIPPYQEEKGWLAHPAGYYGEHLVYPLADFEVNIQFAGERQDLIVAASAPEVSDGVWRRYQHPAARNFAWSVSHTYRVLTQTVGETTVSSYFFPVHDQAGQRVLETTAAALQLYSDLFGAYPRPSLNTVEADFLDGMEYDGLYFLSNGFYNLFGGTPGEYLVAIAAHETAHQWWYARVGNDQALEPWLDEALCTYSERIFYERLFPDALEWWWTYRINYYQPHGWVNDSIYNPHGEVEAYQAYRNAVYLNGAVFLEELRQIIGDEAFFAFLKSYANQNIGTIATGQSFFDLLSQYSQKDISSLKQKFFDPNQP